MDRKVLEERRRRKQQQLRIRRYTKLGIIVAALILLIVFLVRGVIGPMLHKGGSGESQSTAGETTVQTSSEGEASDSSGGADSEAGGESSEGQISTTQTSSKSSLEAVRIPLKGAGDVEKAAYLTPGWHTTENGKFYQNPDGTYYADGFMTIDGVQYSFGADGYIETGWITKGVNDYYFNEDGSYNPDKKRPMLCLTFDDGPGEYTMDLLNCLEENGAHATFFMVGQNVQYYEDAVRKMKEIGCELGNHSWDHPDLTTLSMDEVYQQIGSTDDALITACGQASTVCRAPYGNGNEEIYDAIGKPFILWSLDSEDWKFLDVDADYNAVVNGDLTDGSIILMHDIHQPSVEAAERIIPDLVAQGYRFVTISEMAEAKGVTLQNVRYTDFWQSSLSAGLVPGYNIG